MVTYRKRKGSDTWHWCKNCPDYPTENYDEVTVPPDKRPSYDELDNTCLSMERKRTCRT